MKKLAFAAFVAFWAMVLTVWTIDRLADEPPLDREEAMRQITREELARHDQEDDCWKAIDGYVYDITEYIPSHPTRPRTVTRWCGREATEAYHDVPHSAAADAMLKRYRIGILVD